jgi:hypothetical protein
LDQWFTPAGTAIGNSWSPLGELFLDHTYVTDSTEQTSKNTNRRKRWTSVYSQGSALVFLLVQQDGYRVVITRETWALSDEATTLTKTSRVINMDGVTESRLTLQK